MPSSPSRSESALITAIFVTIAVFCGAVFASISGLWGMIIAAPAYLVLAIPYGMLANLFDWPHLKKGIFAELFELFEHLP